MTVRTTAGPVDLIIRARSPLPWGQARAAVCRAAGLPDDAVLYLGIGPPQDSWMLGSPPLLAGCELGETAADSPLGRPPIVLTVLAGPDAGHTVALTGERLAIGRDPDSDLALTDPAVSWHHAAVEPVADGVAVIDLNSTNGVFVDGAPGSVARTGSLIRIGHSILQIRLTGCSAPGFTPDGAGHLLRSLPPTVPVEFRGVIPAPPPAPARRPGRTLPLASALVGAGLGAGLAALLRNPLFLAFAALGPVTITATAAIDRLRGRRSARRQWREHRCAMDGWRREADSVRAAHRRAAWRIWPGPRELIDEAEAAGSRIWERPRGSPRYLTAAVGSGTWPVSGDRSAGEGFAAARGLPERAGFGGIVTGGAGFGLTQGPGPNAAGAARPGVAGGAGSGLTAEIGCSTGGLTVPDVPSVLVASGAIGLVGRSGRGAARWIIAQLAALHSPADLALVVIAAGPDLAPCRYLPHVPGGSERGVTGGPAAPGELSVLGDPDAVDDRDLLVVLDGAAAVDSPLGRAMIAAAASGPPAGERRHGDPEARRRLAILCLVDDPAQLPAIATLPEASTAIDPELFARYCRALAPLADRSRAAVIPASADLDSVAGPRDPDAIRQRWADPAFRAVLGVGPAGPVVFDLDADGPHLLIAGTTGSGKSELLQTLVATFALHAPPQQLTFLLVDYKGGAAFGELAELPHVVGVLTDLDPALSARALTSLRAELHRREQLTAAGDGPVERLVIVIDEFATLAVELPDFLAGVLDIAQRGRSLGVHLVLATQRPGGVVSPAIRANIAARICLRVTDAAESVDVIGTPEAAAISACTPGRAIMTTGSGRVPLQTALSSAPAVAPLTVTRCDGGRRADAMPARSALAGLIATMRQLCANLDRPRAPWVPPLPDRIDPGSVDQGCIDRGSTDRGSADRGSGILGPGENGSIGLAFALMDVPAQQCHRLIPAPAGSVMVLGPPRSGRTTALRRLAAAAARRGDEVIVIDATGDLADLRNWPQVSSYLCLDEPPLLLRLLTVLSDPAHRPEGARVRHLVIDHYDLVAAELERFDYLAGSSLLADLPARTGGTVRLVVSGPAALAHGRAAAPFPSVITLSDPPGRGRLADAEIQIVDHPAHLPPAAGAPGIEPPAWQDPVIIRALPQRVRLAPLSSPARGGMGIESGGTQTGGTQTGEAAPAGTQTGEAAPGGAQSGEAVPAGTQTGEAASNMAVHHLTGPLGPGIAIGLGGDAASPVAVDLRGPGGAIVICGPRRSGVSTALATLAHQAVAAGIPTLAIRTGGQSIPGAIDIRAGVEPLRDALAAHQGPLLLIADNATDDHPAAELLERFLVVCGPGQHLAVGTRPESLSRARRGFLRTALSHQRGLLLRPEPADGALFDIPVPRRAGSIVPGRGIWVEDGAATPVQIALADPSAR